MGGRGSKSSRAGGGAAEPQQTEAEKLGFTDATMSPFERSHPEHLARMVEEAKAEGYVRTPGDIGGVRNTATPAPRGAPKFAPSNADMGTVMYRDGNKARPVVISRARATGPNGESHAVVSNLYRTRINGKDTFVTRGHYSIARNRLEHSGKRNIYVGGRKGRPTPDEILGKQ